MDLTTAIKQPKIRQMATPDIAKSLASIIGKTVVLAGTSMEAEDQATLAIALSEVTERRYSFLALPEIEIAFSCGVLGDYGEYRGINLRTLNDFLKAYIKSDSRIKAINTPLQLPPPSEAYSLQQIEKMETEAFAYFKKNKQLPRTVPTLLVDYLIAKGRIKTDTYEKYRSSQTLSAKSTIQKIMVDTPDSRDALIRICACERLLIDYYKHLTK